MFRLVRALDWRTDVVCLFLGKDCELNADLIEVQAGDFLIELFRKHEYRRLVEVAVLPKIDLCEDLVGETGGHYEAWMAGCATEVH